MPSVKSVEVEVLEWLEGNGLFSPEAKAIMEVVKAAPENESMEGRWTDKSEDYPSAILKVCKISAGTQAKKWLAENAPKHWARPMFEQF